MSELSIFAFDSSAVRVVMRDSEPWFVASDVCDALGLDNATMALKRLDDDEQALISIEGLSRGNDQANVINESGLYSLILGSRKPEAKRFKKWVTSEVLPTIRKTGRYETPAEIARAARAPRIPGHEADRIVAASRTFNAMLRSSQAAHIPLPTALRRACEVAQRETGIDMLAELRAEEHVAGLEARQAQGQHARVHGRDTAFAAAPLSAACFWGDWHSGVLGLPYQSCTSEQVYRAYQRWCTLGGERFPLHHGLFTRGLLDHCHAKGQPVTVKVMALHADGLRTMSRMLLVSAPPTEALGAWATELVAQFEKHLAVYLMPARKETKHVATTE